MTELKRELGLFTCILLVIGNIIGVGIFTTPGEIAVGLPSAGWVLVAWTIGGLMAMAGALTYGELGAMFPQAGGNYVFLREAYGPLLAFLYGWAYTLVTTAGTIALLALGFSQYLGFPQAAWSTKLFSIFVILVLTLVNARGVKLGAGLMDIITSLKIVAMVALVGLGFLFGHGHSEHFTPLFSGEIVSIGGAILLALVPMAFTYSGWNSTVIVAEEVKHPERLIPLSMIFGTLATMVIYLLMNAVYLYAAPLEQILGNETVAHLAAIQLFGEGAGRIIQMLVATSVLGCLSATLLTNTRTPFAMGRDGLFFKFGSYIHPQFQTPTGAIVFEGLWSCFLILVIPDFDKMLAFVSVPLVIIGTLTVFSLFIFRVKRPTATRPYRCWGYPVVPAIYVLVSIGMVIAKVKARGIFGPIGIGIFILGIPVYYFWKRVVRPN